MELGESWDMHSGVWDELLLCSFVTRSLGSIISGIFESGIEAKDDSGGDSRQDS